MRFLSALLLFVSSGSVFSGVAIAATLNGVTMAETMTVAGKTLQLNGLGTRIVRKFGFPVKVYVGGLYIEKKTQDPKALIEGGQVRRIEMEFVRPVTRDQVVDAWKEGFENNCFVDCEASKKSFNKDFLVRFKSLGKGQKMSINFFDDKMEVEFPGEPAATIADPNLTKNIMAVYFGRKIPNKELTEGMLGLAK